MSKSIDEIGQDLRYAMRQLAKQRSFSLVVTLVLALGIGANGVFLTLVEMICFRGLPIDRPERVMYLSTMDKQGRNGGMSYLDCDDVRTAARSFDAIAAFAPAPMAIGDEGRIPERFTGAFMSAAAFDVIGATPSFGRGFVAEDDQPGATPVVILGSSVWRSRYNSDPSVIGRTVRVNGIPSTVIGVMRPGFRFPINSDVWQPLALMPELAGQNRAVRSLAVIGRLTAGATLEGARVEAAATAARLSQGYPETNGGIQFAIEPINDHYNGDVTSPEWLAFITAGILVLLIACANVSNLLLMRTTERAREVALRSSLGATRSRIVRQLLVESGLLAILGGVVGIALGAAGLRAVSSFVPENTLPYWMDFTMNGPVTAVLAALCLGSSFVFGLVPALHLSRTNPNDALKGGGLGTGAGVGGRHWTSVLLASQVAVAVLLLAHVTLGFRLSRVEQQRNPVIDMPRLLTMSVALPNLRYRTAGERLSFYERLDEQLRAVHSVTSMAVASALPFGGAAPRELLIEDAFAGPAAQPPTVRAVAIGPRYFETLGLPLLRGREFDDRDGTGGYSNAIVNQRLVELHFSGVDPIGRRIRVTTPGANTPQQWLTVVGVSPTIPQRPVPDPDPVVYLPLRGGPPPVAAVIVRSRSELSAIGPLVREAVRQLDPDLPLYRAMTLDQAVADSQWNGRTSNFLLVVVACIAVSLAGVGLYAVTAHSVAQRLPEIGIRMAIGGRSSQIAWLVLKQVCLRLGAGLTIGLLATLVWERLFANYSQNALTLFDHMNVAVVMALLVTVAAAVCLRPLRRAIALDPIAVLRHE